MHVYICFSFLCRPLILFPFLQPFSAFGWILCARHFDFTNKFHDFSITLTISKNFRLFKEFLDLEKCSFSPDCGNPYYTIPVSDFSIEFGNEFCLVIGLKLRKKKPANKRKERKNNYVLTSSLSFSRAQRWLYLAGSTYFFALQ